MNDLVERYTYAVTRHLPLRMRSDVAKELDGLIADMLEERNGNDQPAEKEILAVLTELGAPDDLAAKYSGDENRALISGSYFLLYKRILKIVLPIATLSLAFAIVMEFFLDWAPSQNLIATISSAAGQILGGTIAGAFQAFAIVTLIFAVLERFRVSIGVKDMISRLPDIPKKKFQIKAFEPALGIIWQVVLTVLLLAFPEFAGAWIEGFGWVPAFQPAAIRSLWFFIILWTVLGVTVESVKLIEGQYTKRLAITTVACDILIAISAAIVFLNDKIMNPEFAANIGDVFLAPGESSATAPLISRLNLIILGFALFALILESSVTCHKALTSSR